MSEEELTPRLRALVTIVAREAEALAALLPAALEYEGQRSPHARPVDPTRRSPLGGPPSDPTADAVFDPRRQAVHETLRASERVLRGAAIALRATRVALERAMDRFDGKDLT